MLKANGAGDVFQKKAQLKLIQPKVLKLKMMPKKMGKIVVNALATRRNFTNPIDR